MLADIASLQDRSLQVYHLMPGHSFIHHFTLRDLAIKY